MLVLVCVLNHAPLDVLDVRVAVLAAVLADVLDVVLLVQLVVLDVQVVVHLLVMHALVAVELVVVQLAVDAWDVLADVVLVVKVVAKVAAEADVVAVLGDAKVDVLDAEHVVPCVEVHVVVHVALDAIMDVQVVA